VPGTVNTLLSLTTLAGGALDWLAGLAGLGTDPATFLGLARQVGTGVSVLVILAVALRWRTGDREAAVRAVALLTGVMVLLSPVVHLWYLLWPLPFLAVLPLAARGRMALVAVSVIAGLVAPLDPSLHGAYVAIVTACVIIALLLAMLWLINRALGRRHLAWLSGGSGGRDPLVAGHPGVQGEHLLDGR
jgi:alpha-1,6-mannosyltransferase